MSPLSVIKNDSFLDIFEGLNLAIIGRKAATKQIELLHVKHIQSLKNISMFKIMYVQLQIYGRIEKGILLVLRVIG